MSTPLEIVVTGNVDQATAGLKKVQAELGTTVQAAQKTDTAFATLSKTANTSSQKLGNIEAGATKATSSLSGMGSALLGPIGGFAVLGAALVEGAKRFFEWITAESEAEKTQRLLNTAINQAVASTSAEVTQLQTLVSVARDSNNSREVQQNAINKLNKEYPELLGNLTLENIGTRGVTTAINEQIKALQNAAKAKALSRLVDTTSADLEAAKQKFTEDKAGGYFHSSEATDDLITIVTLTKRLDDYTKALINNTIEQGKDIPHTGRLKQIDDEIKSLQQQKELHASTLAETEDFNTKIKALEDERNAIDPKDIKLKTATAAKSNPFEEELKNIKITLSNELEASQGARLLMEAAEEKANNSIIALKKKFNKEYEVEINKKIELDKKNFLSNLPQIIPNINPADPTDFGKLATEKINPKIHIELDPDLKEKFRKLFGEVLTAEQKFGEDFQKIMTSTINNAFVGIGEAIGNAIGTGGNLGEAIFGSLFRTLAEGIKQLGEAMITLGTAKIVIEKFKLAPGISTVVAGIATVALGSLLQAAIPKFAGGTQNFAGGLALVGERGPELVTLPRGSNVIPNNQINASMSGPVIFIANSRISGNDIVTSYTRQAATNSRNG